MSLEGNGGKNPDAVRSSRQLLAAAEINIMPLIGNITVQGKEHLKDIPEGKRVIVATTHISDLDIPLTIKALGRDLDLAISNVSTQHSLRRNMRQTLGILAAGKSNFIPIDYAESGKNNTPLPFNPKNFGPMAEALESGKAVLVAAHNPSQNGELTRGGYGAIYLNQLADAVILPVAVIQSGEAILVGKNAMKAAAGGKPDANVIIGKPIELPHIDGIEDFKRILEKRAAGEDVMDAEVARFKELSQELRRQSEIMMRALAQMMPEEKRGPYREKQESESTADTSGG